MDQMDKLEQRIADLELNQVFQRINLPLESNHIRFYRWKVPFLFVFFRFRLNFLYFSLINTSADTNLKILKIKDIENCLAASRRARARTANSGRRSV
jgi:hypothetical protein